MSSPRVFVVTGSNKGIGKSIVKLLLQDSEEKIVYLTSRSAENGEKAVKDLENSGFKPQFHQLDITDLKSVEKLRDYLVEKYGGIDVLVNNAGMAYSNDSTAPFPEQAEVTVNCNFFATLKISEVMFPILKQNARVVHVSSVSSEFAYKKFSTALKARFNDPSLSIEGLKGLMNEFIAAAAADELQKGGWVQSAYGTSKVGVSFMTILQQKVFDQTPERNIIVNACCPGTVATDMTRGKYPNSLTPDEGADTPTFLALLPSNATEPKGKFCKLRKAVPYPPTE